MYPMIHNLRVSAWKPLSYSRSEADRMDPNHPNIALRSTPAWGLMQREMFWAPNEGEFQPFDTGNHLS